MIEKIVTRERYALCSKIPGQHMPEFTTVRKCDLRKYGGCHLKTLQVAKEEAVVLNANKLWDVTNRVQGYDEALGTADRPFMDFMKPDGMCEHQYNIGDDVCFVHVTDYAGYDIVAGRGTIIGITWNFATDFMSRESKPHWDYDIYYMQRTDWTEEGNVKPTTIHVPEWSVYSHKAEAREKLKEFIEDYRQKMHKLIDGLHDLTEEATLMEECWVPCD